MRIGAESNRKTRSASATASFLPGSPCGRHGRRRGVRPGKGDCLFFAHDPGLDPASQQVQQVSRRNGRLFHLSSPPLVQLRNAMFRMATRLQGRQSAPRLSWLYAHDVLTETGDPEPPAERRSPDEQETLKQRVLQELEEWESSGADSEDGLTTSRRSIFPGPLVLGQRKG